MAERRSAVDEVVLAAMRLVMGISVQAADEIVRCPPSSCGR